MQKFTDADFKNDPFYQDNPKRRSSLRRVLGGLRSRRNRKTMMWTKSPTSDILSSKCDDSDCEYFFRSCGIRLGMGNYIQFQGFNLGTRSFRFISRRLWLEPGVCRVYIGSTAAGPCGFFFSSRKGMTSDDLRVCYYNTHRDMACTIDGWVEHVPRPIITRCLIVPSFLSNSRQFRPVNDLRVSFFFSLFAHISSWCRDS